MRIKWRKPSTSALKINVDNASNDELRHCGVGCVIRDHDGVWLRGEARSVSQPGSLTSGSLTSEPLAILFGLILESDLREADDLIMGLGEGSNEDWVVIESYSELLSRA